MFNSALLEVLFGLYSKNEAIEVVNIYCKNKEKKSKSKLKSTAKVKKILIHNNVRLGKTRKIRFRGCS